MKKKYTFRKWIALFLSIAMIAASGITTNLHMRAADSTEVEETAKGDAADGTVASGVDSRTAGGEAERGKTEESSQAGGEAAGEAEAGKGGVTAADAGEAAGAAKSGDASAAGEAQGASAASDAEKKEALSEQEQIDQAREGATNTTYSYQDDNITVTAVLDSANAVPDNAKFRVTPITKETAGYNYNAYMDALNDDAAASSDSAVEKQYTGENTLLYDMAFLYEVNVQKEDGSTEQKEVEVQPAEGAVKISVDFKKGQLTDTLDAKSDADVEIKHLPLTDRVKESTDTTAAATDITASDIRVEDVSGADVSVDSQKAEFKADAFSAYAFVQDGSEVTDIKPGTARTAEDVLQDAAYYGITAEKLTQKGHMDSNFAAITYDNGGANFTLGAYTNKKRPGQILAGQVVNELKITTDNPVIVRTPLENEEKIHEGRDKAIVVNTTEEEVGNRVREMLEKVESAGQEMLSEKSYSIEIKDLNDFNNNDHATIDFTKYGSGTFYIDGDSFFSNTSIPYDFKINKNDDQVIVFNFKSETPKFRKFSVNGVQSTTSDASADRYARTILFNMPNATSVSWEGGIFGTVLAPNATVSKFGGTSSGWLVAKDVTVSDGEWHCVYQDMPEYQVETGYSLHAEKLVDHETPEINGFTFSLERKNGDKWEQVAQTVNDGRNVNFSDLQAGFDENRSGIEYITYRISEPQNQTVDGAEYAADGATAYYAKVAVRNTVRYENNKKIKGAEAEVLGYYSDENCTEKTDTPAFNNTRHKTGSASVTLGGHKNVEGIKNPDKVFRFTLSENGQVIDTKTVTGEGDYRFDPITYTEAGDHTYTVAETAGDAAGYTYDAKTYTVKIHVTDDKNGQLQASISGDTTTGEDLDFTNRYQAENTSVQFTGKKTLEGRDLKEGEFQFDLKDPDGNILQTVSNGADGNISFKPVEYTKAGTYSYFISEEVKGENGITYDSKVYPVTVTVTDDGSGELKAEVSGLNADGSGADFKNTYKAKSASVTLGGHKYVEGIENSDKVFRFTLSENGQVIDTKTVTGEGDYRFDPITYTEAGDHTYTVAETAGDAAGYTYDTKTYEVKVSVTDDKNGQLQASISGDTKTGEDLNFTNRYQAAAASARIGGSKTINGRPDKIPAGQFRFDLIENDRVIDTATNDAAGNFVFGRISYPTAGTHDYMIREQNFGKTVNGIKYDAAMKFVTIKVTDDGSGTLKANGAADYSTEADPFNNIQYGSIHVSKSWDDAGNSDQRPSSITVDLIDTKTREMVQRAELSADNNWSADFGQLEAGRNYTVHEEPAGEYYTAQNNDQVVTADISGSAVTLVNTFTHPSVNIYANKVLNGGTLTNGEFTFNLYRNSDPGTVVQTAVNNAAGEIFFTGIAYDASGYTVKEAAGTDSSITYDTAAVTYDAEGNITSADHTEFTNTKRPIVLRVQKRSKAAPYDPLEGAAYGLYQVVPGGNDILIESERSDKNGYMYFGKIEPDTLYYFREISAPEGHEVDPYAGVKFQVKYTGSGEIGIFDENGDPTTVGDITSQDGKALLVQHTSEKTAIPGSASLTYSDDRIVAAAEAPEGAFDAGTTMRVTQLSGDDVKDATAIVEAACGKIKNTVAYYNVGFVDAKGNAVEPKTGDVTVTIQYKDSLNMPEGTDVSALRIVHLKQSGGETGVQAVEGTIASASGELLQTSFTTDSFSTFGIVEPSESSSLNSSYLVTAAGVADQVSKLKVAKLDTSGKYVKGAKLQIIEKATGTVKAEWNTADGPEEFARWFDDAKTVSMNVDTDYILHEVSAPEGYELADDILFRINRYDSSITICKYDGSGKLVPDQEAIDKWVSDATIQMIDVPVVHSKKTTVKQRVVGNERTIQGSDRVVRVSGAKAVKTGDTAQTELFAILFAAAVGVLLVLVLLRRKHENDK
jgi:pilin isopeptide linkage protein/choice-of-anchor A domain-containing protein